MHVRVTKCAKLILSIFFLVVQSCQQLNAEGEKQKAVWHDPNSAFKLCQTSGSGEASPGKYGFKKEIPQLCSWSIFRQRGSKTCIHWKPLVSYLSERDLLHLLFVQIIASAHYMLSELFQLDEPPQEDVGESLRAGGSEDSYSDEDREEEEEEEEELTEDSDDNGSYSSQDDSKAVAVIRSVGELSVPEKYKSTHQIRVSASPHVFPLHSG